MHAYGVSPEEWKDYIFQKGENAYRAEQIFSWIHGRQVLSAAQMLNLPQKMRESLTVDFEWPSEQQAQTLQSRRDATAKVLFEFDSRIIETVWLPYENRQSVCVSVQSGCSLNCTFCASGKMEFKGNLSAGEIVEQVYSSQNALGKKVTNVVYMGMGEPFYNYDAVIKSAHLLHHSKGLNIGVRKITISTSGVLPGIIRFLEEEQPFQLAISLHAAFPEKRREIMDVEKKFPMQEMLKVLRANRNKLRNNQLTFEYVLIDGFNTGKEDIRELAKIAKDLGAKINLIPLNTEYNGMRRPEQNTIHQFWEQLNALGVVAVNRKSPGEDIAGACGQLAGKWAQKSPL